MRGGDNLVITFSILRLFISMKQKHQLQLPEKYYCKGEKYKNYIAYNDHKAELVKDYYYFMYSYAFVAKELKELGLKYVKAWCGKDSWQWLFLPSDKKRVLQYYGEIQKRKKEYEAEYKSDSEKEFFEWKSWEDKKEEWEAYCNVEEDIEFNRWQEKRS